MKFNKGIDQNAVNQSEVITYKKYYPALAAGTIIYVMGLRAWVQTQRPYFYGEFGEYLMVWLPIVIGLGIVYFTSRRIVYINRYYTYHHIIYQEELYSIPEIAEYIKKDEATVRDDVESLIKNGYFKYITYNELTNGLDGAYIKTQKKKIQRSVVRCRGCGAPAVVVEHEFTQCEYCGRKLSYSEYNEKQNRSKEEG